MKLRVPALTAQRTYRQPVLSMMVLFNHVLNESVVYVLLDQYRGAEKILTYIFTYRAVYSCFSKYAAWRRPRMVSPISPVHAPCNSARSTSQLHLHINITTRADFFFGPCIYTQRSQRVTGNMYVLYHMCSVLYACGMKTTSHGLAEQPSLP